MNTILLGFQLGIGLTLAYVTISVIAQILTLIINKILIYRLKKITQSFKPADLNYGKNDKGVR